MATFVREPADNYRYVRLDHGDLKIWFDTWFGAAPLRWTYQGQEIISSHPGEGFQHTIEEGQDLTQATANGETTFHVHRTIDANAYQNYYIRESNQANFPTGATYYQVVGFYPDFWLSHQAQDDSIPPFSDGSAQSGWRTLYTDYAEFQPPNGFFSYTQLPFPERGGAAIFFEALAGKTSGIFMEGNNIRPIGQPWQQRLREIKDGRIAFKCRISLAEASSDAWAGVLFRRSVPSNATTMDSVFNATGYSLNVNRSGLVELRTHNNVVLWSTTNAAVANALNTRYGCLLELRTFNNLDPEYSSKVEIWADQVNLTPVPNQVDLRGPSGTVPVYTGPHVGLIGYTAHSTSRRNYIKFSDRQIFNVGTEIVAKMTPGLEGAIPFVETVLIVRNADGLQRFDRRRLFRVNTVAFLRPPDGSQDPLTFVWTEKPRHTFADQPTNAGSYVRLFLQGQPSPLLSTPPVDAFWSGKGSATLGIYCVPTFVDFSRATFTTRGEHGLVDAALNPSNLVHKNICHINAMPLRAAPDLDPPFEAGQVYMSAKWFPIRA
jgi:hypothetical protein